MAITPEQKARAREAAHASGRGVRQGFDTARAGAERVQAVAPELNELQELLSPFLSPKTRKRVRKAVDAATGHADAVAETSDRLSAAGDVIGRIFRKAVSR